MQCPFFTRTESSVDSFMRLYENTITSKRIRSIIKGNIQLKSFVSLYSKSHFSLSMFSASAASDNATISKSENLGTGPRRGMLPSCHYLYASRTCLDMQTVH